MGKWKDGEKEHVRHKEVRKEQIERRQERQRDGYKRLRCYCSISSNFHQPPPVSSSHLSFDIVLRYVQRHSM